MPRIAATFARWATLTALGASGLLLGCLQVPPPLEPGATDESGPSASAVLWEGRGPGDLYAVGEIRGFEIRQGDQVLGRSWGRYVGPREEPDGAVFVFETRTELVLPGRQQARAAGRLVLDAAGNVVEGFERSDAAELSFVRQDDTLRFTDGTQHDEVLYDPEARPTSFMAHSAFFQEELMLGLRRLAEGELSWRLVSLSGGAPVEWEAEIVRAPQEPGGRAVIRTSLGEEITLVGGRMVRNEVTASKLVVTPMTGDVQWPQWTIEAPVVPSYDAVADGYSVREVELPGRAGEPALFGELLVPSGHTQPSAAVVWVSGTGREDRHGIAGPPAVDLGSHEITDELARGGLVVLRFDDRGRGSSEPGPLTFEGQLEDLRRAYRTLLVQPEVDPDRVLLVAHGEGGLRALSLAAQEGERVAGLALLASPGRPYLEVLRDQGEAALTEVPPKLRAKARQHQKDMLEALQRGEMPPELQDHAGWIEQILTLDPAKMMAKVRGDVWLAQGGKDFEVDPRADSDALLAAAKGRGRRHRVERREYPQLDHLFKEEPDRSTPARYREPGRPVDPEFVAALVEWARRVGGLR